jgi:hypothetical protein
VLVQEPLLVSGRVTGFDNCRQILNVGKAGAAIIILGDNLRVMELAQYNSQYVVAAKITRHGVNSSEALTVVSAYFKYSMPTIFFTEKLKAILGNESRVLIAADANGHSTRWHCPTRNDRGQTVELLIEDHDLTVANMPDNIPTYRREGMSASNIDVTLLSPRIRDIVSEWTVRDDTDSDHNTISFTARLGGDLAANTDRDSYDRRYNHKKADWDVYRQSLIRNKHRINPL